MTATQTLVVRTGRQGHSLRCRGDADDDRQCQLPAERVAGGHGSGERGLVPSGGKGSPDRPGPPRRAAQVGGAGVPAPAAAAAVHLGHVLGLGADREVLEGDTPGLVAGVQ